MRVLRRLAAPSRPFARPVVAIGNFDGVHLGHRAIVERARALAISLAGEVVAFTFHPHPVARLAPERAPAQVLSLGGRLRGLAALDVAGVVVAHFTRAFSCIEAGAFVEDVLVGGLGVAGVVVGHDLRYGHDRMGNAATMVEAGRARGFAVEVVEPILVGGERVSSSAVREALETGQVERAARLLGRPHRVRGRVRQGDRRGAGLGFPTANLLPRGGMLPPDGVYAVSATVDGGALEFPAVANLGTNPTFGGVARRLEVHLLDFSGDLYGRSLEVGFARRLRGEQRFGSVEDLVAQIGADVSAARACFAEGEPRP